MKRIKTASVRLTEPKKQTLEQVAQSRDRTDKQLALERSARIRIHRKEVISRRPKLRVIASRTFARNGRIVTEYMIDGSREYGRGFSFRLVCGGCAKGSR